MMFCTDIHGLQRMNLIDFGDPKTFLLAPSAGQSYFLLIQLNLSTSSRWIGTSCTDIHGSHTVYLNSFNSLTFPLEPPWGSHLWFRLKCLNNYWIHCHFGTDKFGTDIIIAGWILWHLIWRHHQGKISIGWENLAPSGISVGDYVL